ncbi:hypothetical protein [Aurantiacibacter poecillastricola]|uniref:hypothetical protein n=1 Tax=Aurantiacibacter poecillastricola TaxID=3064385 RepID=UPI00273F7B38|nr:hypothetical protein [Aurantiacibacter sp. 219JJ12-13]MDP5262455.1 hypothetical protein [Aurantiacibacter sp. 219JJ12-13]
MPGNYMPANREGWFITFFFVGIGLGVVLAGHLLSAWLNSPWPTYIGWAFFVLLTARFVLFAKRHS